MTQFGYPLGGDLMDGDRYATWDAAYVLGSLTSSERREYEAHLETCERCRAAVAEISGVPALLAMLDLEDVRALDEESSEAPPLRPEVLDSVLDKVRWRRRRSRWLMSGAVGVAAACGCVTRGRTTTFRSMSAIATGPATEARAARRFKRRPWTPRLSGFCWRP